MIVRIEGIAHLPQPGDHSAAWQLPEQCRLCIDFDLQRPIAAAYLTRSADGAIHVAAERAEADAHLVLSLARRRVLALGIVCPDDEDRARVVSVGVVSANQDPRVPEYLMTVEGADEMGSMIPELRDLLLAPPAKPSAPGVHHEPQPERKPR